MAASTKHPRCTRSTGTSAPQRCLRSGPWPRTITAGTPCSPGLLDRSALYGVLAEIEALGLDLLEVRQLTPHRESPESGDSRSQ